MSDEVLLKAKKSKRKKLWLTLVIFGVVLVTIIGAVGYIVYGDLKQEDLLKKEVITLSNKELASDDFSINIVTKGDYVYVEEAIKKYYLQLSDDVKKLSGVLNDEKLIQILSIDNIVLERPNFVNSISLIDSTINSVNEMMNDIANLCDEKTILSFLNKESIDDSYIKFYKEIMLDSNNIDSLNVTKSQISEFSLILEDYLNIVKNILILLRDNNNSWDVYDNQIYFITSDLLNSYNSLYQELMMKNDEIKNKFI